MPTNGKPGANGRFELDFTPVNFSLTEGTNIPPPPDSPTEEKPPPTPPKPQFFANTAESSNGSMPPPPASGADGVQDGVQQRGRTTSGTSIPPLSPASQKRPSSIRRFVSRMSLNQNYVDNGSLEDLHGGPRPPSQASAMTMDRPGLKPKRSGSWFKRFSTSAPPTQAKTPMQAQTPTQAHVTQQPSIDRKPIVRAAPPPRLPDKYKLKSQIPEGDEGSLGGEDMFKNIR